MPSRLGPFISSVGIFGLLLHTAAIKFTGHAQVTYVDDHGHDNVLVWGGYDIIEKFLHYDINNQVDGLYHRHLDFNQDVYRLNVSNPSGGWKKLSVESGARPDGRILHSMSMSSDGASFTIFGGTQCFREDKMLFGYALEDVWRFNIVNQTWTNLVAGSSPDPFKNCIESNGGSTDASNTNGNMWIGALILMVGSLSLVGPTIARRENPVVGKN
uniref:Uncharacterized protein n=2 Tax=Lotharella globosa TaxID=91324 RepID=A0A7S3Z184_9EUKA|mmetsp:Transcript_6779/g.13306  ORF Transcript_6779/g.13306 Transcript_6779/m.13306 type:complete len:214 (-) Transcript_6779:240-881(-)